MQTLKERGLRDTQPRRMVLDALKRMGKPASPVDIRRWIVDNGGTVNVVTIYRILAVLEERNLVHRHACDGLVSPCVLPSPEGHHGFLHCSSCGSVEEFSDVALCRAEDALAKRAGFVAAKHVSEIVGTCSSCSSAS